MNATVKVTKENYRSIRRKGIRICNQTLALCRRLNKRYNNSDHLTSATLQKSLARDLRRLKRRAWVAE